MENERLTAMDLSKNKANWDRSDWNLIVIGTERQNRELSSLISKAATCVILT